jgi:hypothetical protein
MIYVVPSLPLLYIVTTGVLVAISLILDIALIALFAVSLRRASKL